MAARAKTRKRQPARSRKTSSKSLMPWLLTGAIAVAGIFFYENPAERRSILQVAKLDGLISTGSTPEKAAERQSREARPRAALTTERRIAKRETAKAGTQATLLKIPRPGPRPLADVGTEKDLVKTAAIAPVETTGRWYLCASRTDHCVIDGATFMLEGRKIRLAGIEVPRMADAACEAERKRGGAAMERLRALLSQGRITLTSALGTDANGARLHTVASNGHSVERQLVEEGLARTPGSSTRWCTKTVAKS